MPLKSLFLPHLNVLTTPQDDSALTEQPYATASWLLVPDNMPWDKYVQSGGYRYFLLQQLGASSTGHHCLCLAGWEMYGMLTEKLAR